jgi:hypothetical protein
MQHIHCAACGAELVESSALLPDQRPPCPACGSNARRFSVELTDTARASAALAVAVIRPTGIESAQAFGTPAVTAHAEPALGTGAAYDTTVEAEDGQADAELVEEALVEQGFHLWWQQLTASPVTWMAQVYDDAGEELASGVGDDPVEILAGLAERLLPHHPGWALTRTSSAGQRPPGRRWVAMVVSAARGDRTLGRRAGLATFTVGPSCSCTCNRGIAVAL